MLAAFSSMGSHEFWGVEGISARHRDREGLGLWVRCSVNDVCESLQFEDILRIESPRGTIKLQ